MNLEEQVIQAVARGWCHPDNSHKVMDVDLAKAIAAEVVKSFSPAPPENNVRAMSDDLGVTDAALVEAVARAIWIVLHPHSHIGDVGTQGRHNEIAVAARAAIAAMQPAMQAEYTRGIADAGRWTDQALPSVLDSMMQPTLDAAREAGRREGLEQAAQVCETDRLYWMAGKHGICDVMAAEATAYCRNAIRALIPAAPAPMDASDAR